MNYQQMPTDELLSTAERIRLALEPLLGRIVRSVIDVASPQGTNGAQLVKEFSEALITHDITALKQALLNRNTAETLHEYDLITVLETIFEKDKCTILSNMEGVAETTNELIAKHTEVWQRITSHIADNNSAKMRKLFEPGDVSSRNPFIQDLTSHQMTWNNIYSKLQIVYEQLDLENNGHSQLAHLLNPDDDAFLNSVKNNVIIMQGEIGYLAFSRLNELFAGTNSQKRDFASILLKREDISTMLAYNREVLLLEVSKLIFHKKVYPHALVVWLGTAHSIVQKIAAREAGDTHPAGGLYLNVSDNDWSWTLNRIYLQVAAHLGFEFQLMEKQYDSIKTVMMKGNTAALLIALAAQVRPKITGSTDPLNEVRNQYDRGDSISMSAGEYLLLMELGFTAKEVNGVMVFAQGKKEITPGHDRTITTHTRGRSASITTCSETSDEPLSPSDSSSSSHFGSPPPSRARTVLFSTVPSSPQVRNSASDLHSLHLLDTRKKKESQAQMPTFLLAPTMHSTASSSAANTTTVTRTFNPNKPDNNVKKSLF